MANILCMGAAHQNSVFIAAADRVGTERGQPFIGQSLIVSYTGWPIAGPASPDREEILYADCNLADARRKLPDSANTVCDFINRHPRKREAPHAQKHDHAWWYRYSWVRPPKPYAVARTSCT